MKIVFLDIDGPLVTYRAHIVKGSRGGSTKMGDNFDPICVGLLNSICEKTGAKIVISSSWRTGDHGCKKTLIEAGITAAHFHAKHWETPRLEWKSAGGFMMAKKRGDEIADWMLRHESLESYVILDDDADMLDEQMKNFVRVTFEDGIQLVHYQACLTILGLAK